MQVNISLLYPCSGDYFEVGQQFFKKVNLRYQPFFNNRAMVAIISPGRNFVKHSTFGGHFVWLSETVFAFR